MQFSRELRDRVADGGITICYWLWSRPQVKAGGTYRAGSVWIEIDDIDLVPFSSITNQDLALTESRTWRAFDTEPPTPAPSTTTPPSTASSSTSSARPDDVDR